MPVQAHRHSNVCISFGRGGAVVTGRAAEVIARIVRPAQVPALRVHRARTLPQDERQSALQGQPLRLQLVRRLCPVNDGAVAHSDAALGAVFGQWRSRRMSDLK